MALVALELDQYRYIPISVYKKENEDKLDIMFIKSYSTRGKNRYSSFLYAGIPFQKINNQIYFQNEGFVTEYKGQLPDILERFYGERSDDSNALQSDLNEYELWKHFEEADGFIDSLQEIL